jgi:hypothetical protein
MRQIRTQQEKDIATWLTNQAGVSDQGIAIRQMKIAAQVIYAIEAFDPGELSRLIHAANERYRVEQRGQKVILLWPIEKPKLEIA